MYWFVALNLNINTPEIKLVSFDMLPWQHHSKKCVVIIVNCNFIYTIYCGTGKYINERFHSIPRLIGLISVQKVFSEMKYNIINLLKSRQIMATLNLEKILIGQFGARWKTTNIFKCKIILAMSNQATLIYADTGFIVRFIHYLKSIFQCFYMRTLVKCLKVHDKDITTL